MNYYNSIADGYDELYKKEQEKKSDIILKNIIIRKNDKVLDVGCGSGIFLEKIKDRCREAIGIDTSEELLRIASGRFFGQLMRAAAEDIPFEDNYFDLVVSITALQNFEDVEKGLREIKRVGKERFALSFLKKSSKAGLIERLIKEVFKNMKIKRIEQDKDIIYLIT